MDGKRKRSPNKYSKINKEIYRVIKRVWSINLELRSDKQRRTQLRTAARRRHEKSSNDVSTIIQQTHCSATCVFTLIVKIRHVERKLRKEQRKKALDSTKNEKVAAEAVRIIREGKLFVLYVILLT